MHRLITEVGWPCIVICAVLFVLAVPTLIDWVRFEIQLSKRVRAYEARMEAARVSRVRW
jgi:Tfp pilus assembly protein FimT